MTNLWIETIEELNRHGLSEKDVVWVGFRDIATIPWEDFKTIANDFNYNSSYGLEEVPLNLVVCGKNWWLERGEYDGSEWWEFKTLPIMPTTVFTMNESHSRFYPSGVRYGE